MKGKEAKQSALMSVRSSSVTAPTATCGHRSYLTATSRRTSQQHQIPHKGHIKRIG